MAWSSTDVGTPTDASAACEGHPARARHSARGGALCGWPSPAADEHRIALVRVALLGIAQRGAQLVRLRATSSHAARSMASAACSFAGTGRIFRIAHRQRFELGV